MSEGWQTSTDTGEQRERVPSLLPFHFLYSCTTPLLSARNETKFKIVNFLQSKYLTPIGWERQSYEFKKAFEV